MVKYDHIIIILMENSDYTEIIGSTDAPYINNTLIPMGSSLSNITAITHPSLPNYIALTSGATQGVSSDYTIGPPDNHALTNATNLIDRIESAGLTWKAYAEAMPSNWYTSGTRTMGNTGANDFNGNPIYAERHLPWVYYTNINNTNTNPRLANIVPYSNFSTDIAGSASSVPNFVWITPQLDNDMHDAKSGAINRIKSGDNWLTTNIPLILASDAYTKQKTMVIVTWDEADLSGTNQIPTVIFGYNIKANFVSNTAYTLYGVLATIEYGLGQLPAMTANDASAKLLSDIFTSDTVFGGGSPLTSITKKYNVVGY